MQLQGSMQQAENIFREAESAHMQGRFDIAEKQYRQIIRLYPNYNAVYSNLANLLMATKRTQEAVPMLERASSLDPNRAELQTMLLAAFNQLGQVEKALELARKMALQFPENADVHFNLSNLYLYFGKKEEALAAGKKALTLHPDLADGHYNVGNIHYALNDAESAVASFQKAIELNPKLVHAYGNVGYVLNFLSRYEEALQFLQKGAELDPTHQVIQKNLGMVWHAKGDLNQAEAHYRKANELDAKDPETYILLGNVLRDLGQGDVARGFYEKALEIDPKNELAQEQLKALSNDKIHSWHLEMLADKARNQAYDEALKKAVGQGDSVLDIGTGSGLLAMMAARAGASKVYGCEMMPELAEAAKKVVTANGFMGTISVLPQKSTALSVGNEIPEKVDVLVSEILDAGLLGEGVLPTHRHAVRNLLKPGGKVIPQGATVYAMLIESEYLHAVNPIGDVEGFDLSMLANFDQGDVYKMAYLNRIPHRALSEVVEVNAYDFVQPADPIAASSPNEKQLHFPIIADGHLHAVAFWFDLHLDAEITRSTGPEGEMIHWGQAIYYLPVQQAVTQQETLEIKALLSDTLIRFRLL